MKYAKSGAMAQAAGTRKRRASPKARRRSKPARGATVTRERLVEAAIEILRTEGMTGLTTVNLARATGIVQSGFYRHFSDIGECQRLAAEVIADRLRNLLRRLREELLRNAREDIPTVVAYYDALFAAALEERAFVELLIRYRYDPSPLGEVMRNVYAQLRADAFAFLWSLATDAGVSRRHFLAIEQSAEMLQGAIFATLSSVLEGRMREEDLPEASRVLAIMGTRGIASLIRQCLRSDRAMEAAAAD